MQFSLFALFFIPITFAYCCLVPAGALGPAVPGSRRGWVALGLAVLLCGLASRWFFHSQNFVMLSFCSYAIAALVGGVAGRHAWLCGTLATLWDLLYALVNWTITASSGQILVHGRFPVDVQLFLCVILPGLLGGLSASGVLWLNSSSGRSWMQSDTSISPPAGPSDVQ